MKNMHLFIMVPAVFVLFILFAQEQPAIMVEEIAICTAVEEREPVGIDSVFSSDVGQLYCYTKITGLQDTSLVSHVWFHNNEQMASVQLTLKAKTWRTWSSKRIMPDWSGDWRVEIQNAAGELVAKKSFKIQ